MKEKMVIFTNLRVVVVVGDSLNNHIGMKFSTIDVDNDNYPDNCAAMYPGGWWYMGCYVFPKAF